MVVGFDLQRGPRLRYRLLEAILFLVNPRQVDVRLVEIRCDLNRPPQQVLRVFRVVCPHRQGGQHAQRIHVVRLFGQHLAVDALGLVQLALAVQARGLGQALPAGSQLEGRLEGLVRFLSVAEFGQGLAQVEGGIRAPGVQACRALQQGHGFLEAAQADQENTQVLVGFGEVGCQFDGLAQVGFGLGIPVHLAADGAVQAQHGHVAGIALQGLLAQGGRPAGFAAVYQVDDVIEGGAGDGGIRHGGSVCLRAARG